MKRFEKSPRDLSLVIAIVIGLIGGTACHAGAVVNTSRTLPQLVADIVTRAQTLNYISEQDSEVCAFYRNTPVREIGNDVFLQLLRRPAETRIVRQSWSSFIEIQMRKEPGGAWKELRDYLETNLTDLTVFYLPRDEPYGSQYELYAVGLFNGETVVGIQTFGVAT